MAPNPRNPDQTRAAAAAAQRETVPAEFPVSNRASSISSAKPSSRTDRVLGTQRRPLMRANHSGTPIVAWSTAASMPNVRTTSMAPTLEAPRPRHQATSKSGGERNQKEAASQMLRSDFQFST